MSAREPRVQLMSTGEMRVDVGSRFVYSCAFVGDCHIVLACAMDGLVLIDDKEYKVQSTLPGPSYCIAIINANEILVTQGHMNEIQRVSLFPRMVATGSHYIDKMCYGLDVCDKQIYVTCHDSPGNGEVRVLDMAGQLMRRFGADLNSEEYMFVEPDCVKVSKDASKIFVSDSHTNLITCLNQQGQIMHQFSDKDLASPAGMYVDEQCNLLVCGRDSHNIHILAFQQKPRNCSFKQAAVTRYSLKSSDMSAHDGDKHKIFISQMESLKFPLSIAYRPRDERLLVGLMDAEKALLVYFVIKIGWTM